MNSHDLYPRSLHGLWMGDSGSSSIFKSISKQSDQIQSDRLYAPPLAAYTANSPGPDPIQMEFLLNAKSSFSSLGLEKVGPYLVKKKLQSEAIRSTGYSTIRPIGIGKTMEELDYANPQYSRIDESGINLGAENTIEGESSTLPLVGLGAINDRELDLDAEILDADGINSDNEDEGEEDIFEESIERDSEPEEADLRARVRPIVVHDDDDDDDDEGFMADDVEYQDDHSLESETNASILMNSGAIPAITSAQIGGARSSFTNPTTAASGRTGDEQHYDNENEYSEHDMLVD
ncbi:uncharacterized protein LODBEIA_P08180 [Lodderomyces beijingensis]|uniref:Anaphase-promoting complex subunit 13 n=1 Tax=Lodderomyces beijingensis TaxID=1775926 RepID=A0ABP0ZEL2_9ASCO